MIINLELGKTINWIILNATQLFVTIVSIRKFYCFSRYWYTGKLINTNCHLGKSRSKDMWCFEPWVSEPYRPGTNLKGAQFDFFSQLLFKLPSYFEITRKLVFSHNLVVISQLGRYQYIWLWKPYWINKSEIGNCNIA